VAERFHVEQSRRTRWKLQTARGRTAEAKAREVLRLLREIQVDTQVMTSGIVMICDRTRGVSVPDASASDGTPLEAPRD
jgi:hypothetical protein